MKASLRRDGYAEWPNAVPADRIERALGAIHRNLGERGIDPKRLVEYEMSSYCPELRADPAILGLFVGTPLERTAERLLGPLEPVNWAQIALRFPRDHTEQPAPHLDGIAAPGNRVPKGAIHTFSALAGVYLSDVPAAGGAFTVWPGSHERNAAFFAEHGPESLLAGMPPVLQGIRPQPIAGRPGHGFLVHYLVAHAVGVHRSHGIRYAVFFRLRARGHEAVGRRTMVEPWREWRLETEER